MTDTDETIVKADALQDAWLKGTADGSIPDHDSRQIELVLKMGPNDVAGIVTCEVFRTNPIGHPNSTHAVDIHFFRDGLTFGVEAVTRQSLMKLVRFLDTYLQRMSEF